MAKHNFLSYTALFHSINGQLPKIFYALPPMIWGTASVFYFCLPHLFSNAIIKHSKAQVSAYALNLQEDINYMSSQVQGLQLFDLSKKEIISDNRQENFLLEKARRKLEQSPMAKSEGKLDHQQVVFDSALNTMVLVDTQKNPTPHPNYLNKALEQHQLDQEAHRLAEMDRTARIEKAKQDNRKRRLALEEEHIDYAAQAYELGIQEQNRRYQQFHNNINQITDDKASKKEVKNKLSFSTKTGVKNSLLTSNSEGQQNSSSPTLLSQKEIAPPSPIYAAIDQATKIRSGDKIQIRLTQAGFYRGMILPKDHILYGICRINQNRVEITIPSIQINEQLLRTNLVAYDQDGIKGIYVDGTFNELSKDLIQEGLSASNHVTSNRVGSGGLGLRSPLGNVSIKLGRKANNRLQIHIPAAYQILLYDGHPEELEINSLNTTNSNQSIQNQAISTNTIQNLAY